MDYRLDSLEELDAFDSYGNLWGTHVYSDQLFVITPQGDYRVLLDEGDPEQVAALESAFFGNQVDEDALFATGRGVAPWMASVTFGAADILVSAYRMRNTRERWAKIVDDMVSRGAEATDEEIERIIDFLTAHYGTKVNINKASAQELSNSLGISMPDATSIVDYRTRNGAFGKVEGLKAVPHIDWKAIESQKDRIEFLK